MHTLFTSMESKGGGLILDSFFICTFLANAKFTMLILFNAVLLLVDGHSKFDHVKEVNNLVDNYKLNETQL